MSKQPEAMRIFTRQLLDDEDLPNGVHIGCDDLDVCKRSYVYGETSPVIHEWVDAAELRRLHEQNQELLEALRDVINTLTDGPDESDVARVFRVARSAIAKATEPRVNT